MNKKRSVILLICTVFALFWPGISSALTARDKYAKAEACSQKLLKSRQKQQYRHNWLACIEKFQTVYRHDPSGPWAAAGLYRSGRLYELLYKRSFKKTDLQEAVDFYQRIVKRFPKSRYRQKVATALQSISALAVKKRVFKKEANGKQKADQIRDTAYNKSRSRVRPPSTVTGLRFWSNPTYTRLVIDADAKISYNYKFLKKESAIQKQPRLYIDLKQSRLGKDIKKFIPIDDNLLRNVRAAQKSNNSVRVVIDIKSFKIFKVFALQNPFRIVVDVWGNTYATKKTKSSPAGRKDTKVVPGSLAKQLALGVKRIVIDPGHGGHDFGAPGYFKGIHEKNIVLQIAGKLAKKIRKKLGIEVVVTRNSDRYLSLEERTAIANTKNADLFISIHTNSAKNRQAYGIETYFLNLATDDEAILVAARENATSTKNISDLERILFDLMHNAKINESSRLAGYVQESLNQHMKRRYKRIKNKGVKQAPFYVLLGAQMPSILIETSFISNARECRRLLNADYQEHLAEAIVKGIKYYIRDTHRNTE
ncbi:MAG: N-acetylmuramoyl-L-alanine amidase [Desulfobacterales bacterium]|nr:N-acetylmuramoyl-L-alanine amidase [Desulfobacter sp.]MDP6681976.1 N-acetylmuramoyl-L-alanine amidase [Desulfobacterales bacterium]MDP6808248.1 N-acetylmuramoyl-L-alanine amidase [Desulfobacterales bacterium]